MNSKLLQEKFKKAFRRLKNNTHNFSDLLIKDVFDFVDFQFFLDENIKNLILQIKNNQYYPKRPYILESPKNKGINRQTLIFNIDDMLVYRFCIVEIEDYLFKKVRLKNIRGGRKIKAIKTKSGQTFYEKWFDDWIQHNQNVEKSMSKYNWFVKTDIASYFDNINLLALNNLVRIQVPQEQKWVVDLLFYFLDGSKIRYNYEVNNLVGLPQENIDCSRILAYFYLYPHDEEMMQMCKEEDIEYFRFVDDMIIAVNSETQAKKVLRKLTESLRKLNLLASLEKSDILNSQRLKQEMFIEENKKLSEFEQQIKNYIKLNDEISRNLKDDFKKYYRSCLRKNKYKNFIKILKRFYTIFTYIEDPFLAKYIKNHIINYPILGLGDKITKYLFVIKNKKRVFNNVIIGLIDYLYSEENLYPALESNILETILYFEPDDFDKRTLSRLRRLSEDIFFRKNGLKPNSEYSRSLACLMIYRFDKGKIESLATHYLKANELDINLKKYLIAVSLLTKNQELKEKVLRKAKNNSDASINRLLYFIENLDPSKGCIKNYLKQNKVYILFDKENKIKIEKEFNPIRSSLLKDLIDVFGIYEHKRSHIN